jgi:hypothetical protein
MDSRIPTVDEINAMTDADYKVLENRLRRAAKRQGLVLIKSRSRDPRAIDYGGYMLADAENNTAVAGELGSPRSLSLTEIAEALLETSEKLEVKGRAIEQFRFWLRQDQRLVEEAIRQISQGEERSALATLHTLQSQMVKQQES